MQRAPSDAGAFRGAAAWPCCPCRAGSSRRYPPCRSPPTARSTAAPSRPRAAGNGRPGLHGPAQRGRRPALRTFRRAARGRKGGHPRRLLRARRPLPARRPLVARLWAAPLAAQPFRAADGGRAGRADRRRAGGGGGFLYPGRAAAGVLTFTPSAGQRALWVPREARPEATRYNEAVAIELRGASSPEQLERALGQVIARHAALRMAFRESGGRLYAVLREKVASGLDRRDLPAADRRGPGRGGAAAARRGRPAASTSKPADSERCLLFRAGPEHFVLRGGAAPRDHRRDLAAGLPARPLGGLRGPPARRDPFLAARPLLPRLPGGQGGPGRRRARRPPALLAGAAARRRQPAARAALRPATAARSAPHRRAGSPPSSIRSSPRASRSWRPSSAASLFTLLAGGARRLAGPAHRAASTSRWAPR